MNDIIKELNWRGLVKQITNENKVLNSQKMHSAVYCGFDPTADSLHVGHLMMITTLKRFQDAGFQPIVLIGGGTGMIGDPSFKSAERVLQTSEQVQKHANAISNQIKSIISEDVIFANNADWLNKMTLIEFLRDVGKDFNLSYLLAKESIANRISTGLSITEFSYTMLQAYDFFQLYNQYNCQIQIGGSDQWGNITSGIDYIAYQIGRTESMASGFTIPLLTKSDGTKFGKTESGAIWLDKNKTSEFDFYQFWLNQDDNDCENMLKFLTFLTNEQISALTLEHKQMPSKRVMQKALAYEMTMFVHNQSGLDKAISITKAVFEGNVLSLDAVEFKQAIELFDKFELDKSISVIEALIAIKATTSKREAREFLTSNGISINEQVISDEHKKLSEFDLLHNQFLLIKRGKKKHYVIVVK